MRILIVEDEVLIAMSIEDVPDGSGCDTAGPDDRFDDRPVLQRPFKPTELRATLAKLAADRPRRPP